LWSEYSCCRLTLLASERVEKEQGENDADRNNAEPLEGRELGVTIPGIFRGQHD